MERVAIEERLRIRRARTAESWIVGILWVEAEVEGLLKMCLGCCGY